MGLDIYVGSLTRYYSGNWETIMQRTAREQGIKAVIVRPNGTDESRPDAREVNEAALLWRKGLATGLAKHLTEPMEWNEGLDGPYFTDKPDWDGYWALLLWAAYQEHGEYQRPQMLPASAEKDSAYRASTAAGFKTAYPHLLRDVQLWLPVDFAFTFGAQSLSGDKIEIGSSNSLSRQLDSLNDRTWMANDESVARWLKDGPPAEKTLGGTAQFGFAVMRALTREAVQHKLPMLLDY